MTQREREREAVEVFAQSTKVSYPTVITTGSC